MPVGGGQKSGPPIEEFASNKEVDNSGPIEQRLASKNWLVRANAFDEMTALFRNANSEKAQEFRDHSSSWKKYLADANPGSLEKCLDALEQFITRAEPGLVASSQNEIIKALIEKCVGHAKAAIKNKSLECFSLLFEVTEAFDESIEPMTESLSSKNAKISQNALIALNHWLSNYGVKKIKVKTFITFVETAAGSSNPSIRSEAMTFYKECYKGYGDGVKPLMANIKKQQQEELDKEFALLKELPKPEYRKTRKEQKKAKEAALDDIIKKEEEEKKADNDAFDLYDPVDLVSKFGSPEWLDKLGELKDWKAKKEMLEELLKDSDVPKIKPGDFTNLAKILKKLIGDSNAVVSNLAIKIVGNLAKGLRKDFENCTKELTPALIQKFKEKKTQIIEDIKTDLDHFLNCTNIENLQEEIITGLGDKAPIIKINLCNYLEKACQVTYIDVLQRTSAAFLPILMKTSDDSQGDVRDAALKALGIFKGRLGDSAMAKFLNDLNPQKLEKVNQSAQNVKPSKYDRPLVQEKKAAPAATAPGKKAPAKKAPVKKESIKEAPKDDPYAEDPQSYNPPPNDDDRPVKGSTVQPTSDPYAFDEMPIGGKKQNAGFGGGDAVMDEQPIGGKGGYNLDNLDDMDAFGGGAFGNPPPLKPKAKPPARLAAKKPVAAEEEEKAIPTKPNLDVEMADETVASPKKVEVKKPPPKPAPEKKPAAATSKPAAAGGKGAGAPSVQEEDVGAGLSKEEAEAKVQENFPADVVSKFEEAKWQDKVEGFKRLGELVTQMNPGADIIEAVAKFVKMKMKDWKESNINLCKEAVNLMKTIATGCDKINKRAVVCYMPFLTDKIGDVKFTAMVTEVCTLLSDIVTPKFIGLQLIKYGVQQKAPKAIQETCNQLRTMVDDYGAVNMPLKEMIDMANFAIGNTNPQVRTSAMALFAIMFQHVGETIKNFLKDIKESTMKLLEEEFAKVTPYKKGEYVQKRRFRGEAAQAEEAAPKKGGGGLASMLDDALPRQDISKLFTAKIKAMCSDNNWKSRKEAAEKVEEMCRGANMRIKPDGLNELMEEVKKRMTDANKAVLKAYIQLMGVLVEALGQGAKQFQKKLLPGMLATIADKQSLVRGDAIACMDKWAEHVGPEIIINNLPPQIQLDNPESRTESLKWILGKKDSIKTSDYKELVKPLVASLSDKTPQIRGLAEEVVTCVMPLTGFQAFQSVTTDLLPAQQQTIKPVLEKIKQKVGAINVLQDQMMGSSGAQQQARPGTAVPAKKEEQPPAKPTLKPTLKPKQSTNVVSNAQDTSQLQNQNPQQKLNQSLSQTIQPKAAQSSNALTQKKENQTPASKQTMPQRSESKEALRPKGLGQSITNFKQADEPMPLEKETLNVNFGFKEKRAELDKKNKFQLEDIKGEQLEKMKAQATQALGLSFVQKMYSNDFKQNCECIDAFANLSLNQPEAVKEILDIMFKWVLYKLQGSPNTQYALQVLDFISALLEGFEQQEYQLQEVEANILIPLLCEKTGFNNSIIKEKVKKLVKQVFTVYDLRKSYQMMVQYGLNSKNLRAQAECLDELAEFIIKFGIDYCSEKDVKLVAKMADNADKSIRENALKFMGEAYKILDDNIWRVIGEVTPKVQGLLEQRFKKLKGGPGGGLQASASQSNFYRPDTAARQQSPSQQKDGFKTQSNFGVKASIQQSQDMGKQATTPRGGLQFSKFQSKDQQSSAHNNLSKSINQFNSSNRSNEEKKQTPQGIPRKQDMLKKVMSQDQPSVGQSQLKRPFPQTQRPTTTDPQDLNLVQRNSESQVSQKSTFAMQKQQAQKNQIIYDDDDEDLRILTNDENFRTDPEFERQKDEITKHIHQLKYADLSKRVDSLVSLNEMISAIETNKDVLVRSANDLVSAFTHVLNDIFDKNVEDIPLRFAKYFITIVLKTCSCKEIMKEVSEEKMFDLAEQLLTRLLIENLDKVGDNKEGELILKNLNSSMLRLLENCNHTYIFCVLFNLLRKYKDYPQMPKLPNLIIKCLLKLSKILEKLIDKLDMEKILLAIHEYLIVINHDNKTQNDEMGIRIVKTVTNELVKLKRDQIWEAYQVIQAHGIQDQHIFRWIQIILRSLQSSGGTPSTGSSNAEVEIKQLVEELRVPERFESTIPKLQRFLDQNPQINLNEYLVGCSQTFQQFILSNLQKHKAALKEETKQDYGMMNSLKSADTSDTNQTSEPEPRLIQQTSNQAPQSNRISEYQSKLASIKQRNLQKTGSETTTHKDQGHLPGHQQNLNTSFSAMNSSLSQKWNEIKYGATRRETTNNLQQMSNTMGGFASGNAFESKIGMGQNATQQPMNQSIGAGSEGGGATNQDLNKRLAEMKERLQALKKK